jgi:hypothetical protein
MIVIRSWGEEAETDDDYCRALERGESLCRERARRMSCMGMEDIEMVMFLERGRQVGGYHHSRTIINPN